MTDDLISRSELIQRFAYYHSHSLGDAEYAYGTAVREVQDAPAEDAELIIHAYWEEVNPKGWMPWGYLATAELKCSNCGEEAPNYSVSYSEQGGSVRCWTWIKTRRCPWCGAHMDAKEDDNA